MSVETLFIDPDLNARLRFKQAVQLINVRVGVATSTRLVEGLQKLDSQRTVDVVYLSSRFDKGVVSGFVSSARRTRQGKNAAYMVVVPAPECDTTRLAGYAFAGADGFLLEPYSATSLEDTLRTGLITRNSRSKTSDKLAMEIIVKSLLDGLDEFRKRHQNGLPKSPVVDRLRKSTSILKSLNESKLDDYYSVLCDRANERLPALPRRAVLDGPGIMPRRVTR